MTTGQIVTAILTGIVVWSAMHMFYSFRKQGEVNIRRYIAGLRSWKVCGLYLAALAGMVFFFLRAGYFGLPYVNCVRNGLVFGWLLIIALIDSREQLIPRPLTTAGLAGWLLLVCLSVFVGGNNIWSVLLFSGSGWLLGGGLFFLCRIFSKGGVGMGDIRMFSVLGLLYGMNYTFSILFFTILFMSIFGIIAALCKKKSLKSMIAMGPFALAAFCVSCLLGV